jgi:opacity protein-like surface antigen
MKKLLLSTLVLCVVYGSESKLEKLSPEEHMIKHPESYEKYHPRAKGYMPRIITPEEEKSGVYGGLALSSELLKSSSSLFSDDNYMLGLSVIAGFNFNKYLALESRVSTSAGYDDGVDLTTWSIFLKPKYELYNNMNLYSLIGVGGFDARSINADTLKSKKQSIHLGIGADYQLGDNFKIFADYIYRGEDAEAKLYESNGKVKSSAITTGITYDF